MTEDYLTLAQAADYLSVNRVKFARMVKKLGLMSIPSPFDERVKLFRREDIDKVKRSPRPVQGDTNG